MSSTVRASSRSRSRSSTASAPASLRGAEVVGRREEALREERRVGRGAGGAEVVPRARRSARRRAPRSRPRRRRVGGGDARRVGVGAEVARRRRAALDLRDRRRGRACASASAKRPIRATPREKSTSSSSRVAASPESSARRATPSPSREVVGVPGRGDRSRGVEQDRVALRAAHVAGEDRADLAGVLLRAAARERRRVATARSRAPRGRCTRSRTSPSTTSETRFGPHGESSSIPPKPCTTNARRVPSWASASAIVRTRAGE